MTTTPTAVGGVRPGDIAVTAVAPAAWGLTHLTTTEFLPADRPLLAGTLRAFPAGIMLAALAPGRPHGAWWWKAAALGALNVGAFFALLFAAAYRLPGGVAATLGAIRPLIAAGLAATLLREPLRSSALGAAAVGIVGVALLVLRSNAHLDPIGIAAGLAAAASMASGVVLTKRWGRPYASTPLPSSI
jgi:probable blue pigment (indigoidine) exporter